jgi:hypothetical protein
MREVWGFLVWVAALFLAWACIVGVWAWALR